MAFRVSSGASLAEILIVSACRGNSHEISRDEGVYRIKNSSPWQPKIYPVPPPPSPWAHPPIRHCAKHTLLVVRVSLGKVDVGFDAEFAEADSMKGHKGKHTEMAGGSMRTLRHRAWLIRASGRGGGHSWRPRKLHRVASKRVLMNLDNQLLRSTVV